MSGRKMHSFVVVDVFLHYKTKQEFVLCIASRHPDVGGAGGAMAPPLFAKIS